MKIGDQVFFSQWILWAHMAVGALCGVVLGWQAGVLHERQQRPK